MPAGIPITLADMRGQVSRWLMGENLNPQQINDAINDAIESLWMSLMLAVLQIFLKGPIPITIESGSLATQIVTIADPVTAPPISQIAGGSLGSVDYYFGYTYVTDSGSETLLSPVTAFTRSANMLAVVTLPTGSVYPNNPQGLVDSIGWNLYVGIDQGYHMIRQNGSPIPFVSNPAMSPLTLQTFTEPLMGFNVIVNTGPLAPTQNSTADNLAYIRHLEFQTPNAGLLPYNSADLDSITMRRFAAQVATSSPYQRYAWNLIDQRSLQIRPAAGTTFIPQYYFIQKPRRLNFDNSKLPFPSISCTDFFKSFSLSELFLSLHEYQASEEWNRRAEQRRMEAVRAVSQINSNVNDRVAPYLY